MSRLKDDSVIVAIGRRRSGKSTLIRDILWHKRNHIPVGAVVSATEHVNKFFGDFIPSVFIHDDSRMDDVLAKVIQRQTAIVKQKKKEIQKFGKSNINSKAFCLLDDCAYSEEMAKNARVRAIFFNGRHLDTFFIFTLQFPMGVPPKLRTNIDYSFLYADNIQSNLQRLYMHYCGMFPCFDDFQQVFKQATKDHSCLVVDNTCLSGDIRDCVFWYKAEIHPPFQMCGREYWEISKQIEAKKEQNEDDGEEMYEPKSRKKNANIINLKKK